MNYTPERFGLMLVGDFLDAMEGHNEREGERFKGVAELIRTSTTILVNVQLARGDKVKAHELWSFSWDKQDEGGMVEVLSEEEVKRREDEMEKILNQIMPG